MIPEGWVVTNEACLIIVPIDHLQRVPKSHCMEVQTSWRLADFLSPGDGVESTGRLRQLEFAGETL